MGDRPAPG